MLQSGATKEEISALLDIEPREHFGLEPNREDLSVAATRVCDWFERGWRKVLDPVTVFVSLLDEGTDVWRPVQARPLGGNLYRIIGVDADLADETWQFSPGAIV